MSDFTPNLSMPFILPAQAQKHVTHNEAIELLDLLVQLTLEESGATMPPASPAEGESWGIGTGATGDWVGQDGQIATWRGGGWLFVAPVDGWTAWVRDIGELQVLNSGVWVTKGAAFEPQNVAMIGVNTTADAINRLAVSSEATLLNNVGAGHQLKINKAGVSDTASLLYQSGWSGRAEMGLSGSDDFSIKVSADGASWFTAIGIDGADGRVRINQVLHVEPSATPGTAAAGDVYFDSTTNKLRCHDGTGWQDLF
ncbi:hypothetical protein DS901_00440 [Loktanella sp. D2R18]|uniref:DUF2793 domain-containing protein n=1 Tax=Rhodobacterales TaxID=204455 RepID=UPI000DE9CFFA|nr:MULTISPECIES: DUF2793 domain-containing protein [Rhodobacterales]MDO6591263.1 DUF2793 domain-containing protein [Yoonia sp. 1_MG-2023]RBW46218.1 hypothetical protein DS901_00440 [Loktanella sp. D2R18]